MSSGPERTNLNIIVNVFSMENINVFSMENINDFVNYIINQNRNGAPIPKFSLADLRKAPKIQQLSNITPEEKECERELKMKIMKKMNKFMQISNELYKCFNASPIKIIIENPLPQAPFDLLIDPESNISYFGRKVKKEGKARFCRQYLLKHSCILPLLGWGKSENADEIYLLYQRIDEKLSDVIHTIAEQGKLLSVIKKLLYGVAYLHSKFLHLDIQIPIYIKSDQPIFCLIDFPIIICSPCYCPEIIEKAIENVVAPELNFPIQYIISQLDGGQDINEILIPYLHFFRINK